MEESTKISARGSGDEEEAHLFDAPPPYELHATGDVLDSSAAVTGEACQFRNQCHHRPSQAIADEYIGDGRINVTLTSKSPAKLAELLHLKRTPVPAVHELVSTNGSWKCPSLNVVIHVVGSRGKPIPTASSVLTATQTF